MRMNNNQYKTWTPNDDKRLIIMIDKSFSKDYICEALGRTERGVGARLRRLGVVRSSKEFTMHYPWPNRQM